MPTLLMLKMHLEVESPVKMYLGVAWVSCNLQQLYIERDIVNYFFLLGMLVVCRHMLLATLLLWHQGITWEEN